jgi:hypothetical protein
MNPFTSGVIMLRFALGASFGAAPFVSSAVRLGIAVGLGISNPGSIWQTGEEWKQTAAMLEVVKTRITNANVKVNPQWIAEDKDAYLNAVSVYNQEVDDLKKYLENVGTGLQTVAAAYYAFAVMAIVAGTFAFACAVAVGLAMATPAFPAVRAAAEAAVSAVAMTAGAAAKTITAIAGGATAILLAGVALSKAFQSQPGGVKGADFKVITIDYSPLTGGTGYVAPRRELPGPAK